MLDLNRLRVSLTKHGAHKLAPLLEKYKTNEILSKLWDVEPGINIELAQAKKNLSVDGFGNVPDVWTKAKAAGSESVRALVLIGIIFSHYDMIDALRQGRLAPFRGTIKKKAVLDGKAFTNAANNIAELGYSASHTEFQVTYNFEKLFEIPGLSKLALELIALKFRSVGWDGTTNLIDELATRKLGEVFSISDEQFRNWLTTGDIDAIGDTLEDEDFFLDTGASISPTGPFKFTHGHSPKKTGKVTVNAPTTGTMASLLHNELQTALYKKLCAEHGAKNVGTEKPTGHGTSIDVVVNMPTSCWFYEIKVAKTLKACIRQAIPQLLEYAYWRDDTDAAERLYIASKFAMTKDAQTFLDLLRNRFGLPLYYEQVML